MDLTAVFEGLAAAADQIDGLRCHAFTPDSIVPPTFFVVDAEIQFDLTFSRGMDDINPITCRLLVSRASDRAGHKALQSYMAGAGPMSVKAALEDDPTLGGACDSLHVMRVTGMGLYQHANTEYIGADFSVRVIGSGG